MKWFLLAITLNAYADLSDNNWALASGKLTYHVNFPLKKVDGTSDQIKGKGHCDAESCEFLVAAPVNSFQSGDGNRDSHMLEVTKAALFPLVTAHLRVPKSALPTPSFSCPVEIHFGSEVHTYQVQVKTRNENGLKVVNGTVPIKLSEFKMERPSLLGIKIKDEVPVEFELKWQ